MTHTSRTVLALLIWAAFASPGWGQRGIPVPRTIPRPGPIHPVVPHTGSRGGSDSTVDPVAVIGGVVAVLGAGVGLVFGVRAWRNRTIAHLLIVRTPPGEAPEEIRRAWVGIELPLRRGETEPSAFQTVGVVSHQGAEMSTGYAVRGRAAVDALASLSPEAAAWWRENAPHVVARGYRLWFPSDVCQRVA
jgi:hypothetical protein